MINSSMTYHCAYDRKTRIKQIINNIGIGNIIIERWQPTSEEVSKKGYTGKYKCITDTGITIIKSEDKTKIITMYVTTMGELVYMYNGIKRVPKYLINKVNHNQSKYILNGKTIW